MAPSPSVRAAPRWMRAGFALSLALNLLVGGFVLGDALGGDRRPPRPVEMELGPLARALSPDDRRAILGGLGDDPAFRPLGREARAAGLAELRAALTTDPFDPARARAVLDAQDERLRAAQDAVEAALVARLAAMTPAERAALAGRLHDGPDRDH